MHGLNVQSRSEFNPLTAKLFYKNFHPLEMSEHYSDFVKYCCLMSRFIYDMFKSLG